MGYKAGISVILALLGTPVLASDFRVLDFGSPCAEAVELEEALGSEPLPSRSGPNQQTFKGRVFNHEATIIYLCPNGMFALGNYAFPEQTFVEAFKTLHDIYDGLNVAYGVPYIDTSRWQYGTGLHDSPIITADPAKYTVAWRDQRVFVNIHMFSKSEGTAVYWSVIVVFGRTKT